MVQIFGSVRKSFVENDNQFTIFRIPAFSEGNAQRRARINSRLKGLDNPDIVNVENVGSLDLPRQSLYDVTVKSNA